MLKMHVLITVRTLISLTLLAVFSVRSTSGIRRRLFDETNKRNCPQASGAPGERFVPEI